MPSKKTGSQSQSGSQPQQSAGRPPSPILISEGADPITTYTGVVEKKARNLEKRKVERILIYMIRVQLCYDCVPPSE